MVIHLLLMVFQIFSSIWLDNGSNFSSGTPDSTWIDSDDTKRGSFGLMDNAVKLV